MNQTIIFDTGDTITYVDGLVESIDYMPAIVTNNGYMFWFKAGKLHRENNGPACFSPFGVEYWLNGVQYSKDEWNEITGHDDHYP